MSQQIQVITECFQPISVNLSGPPVAQIDVASATKLFNESIRHDIKHKHGTITADLDAVLISLGIQVSFSSGQMANQSDFRNVLQLNPCALLEVCKWIEECDHPENLSG